MHGLILYTGGVSEGRQIFVNLKRSIQSVLLLTCVYVCHLTALRLCFPRYTLSHITPEVIPQLLCTSTGFLHQPNLIVVVQMLLCPCPCPYLLFLSW